MTKEEKLARWEKVSAKAKELKDEEMKLRNELLFDYFKYDGDDRKGTTNYPLENNCKLKAIFKLNFKLENKNDETRDMVDELRAHSTEAAFVADRLVKWKPEISISDYNQLSLEFKTIVDTVLTISPGTPTLDIMYPKKKK